MSPKFRDKFPINSKWGRLRVTGYTNDDVLICRCECGTYQRCTPAHLGREKRAKGEKRTSGCRYCKRTGIYVGSRFGLWEVLDRLPPENGTSYLRCKCHGCGNIVAVASKNLKSGRSKSCGNCKQIKAGRPRGPLRVGHRIGALVVTEVTGKKKNGSMIVKCRCLCGNPNIGTYTTRNLKRMSRPCCGSCAGFGTRFIFTNMQDRHALMLLARVFEYRVMDLIGESPEIIYEPENRSA